MERNYKFIFEDGKYVIYDKNNGHRNVITIPLIKNRLFPCKFEGEGTQLENVLVRNKN